MERHYAKRKVVYKSPVDVKTPRQAYNSVILSSPAVTGLLFHQTKGRREDGIQAEEVMRAATSTAFRSAKASRGMCVITNCPPLDRSVTLRFLNYTWHRSTELRLSYYYFIVYNLLSQ